MTDRKYFQTKSISSSMFEHSNEMTNQLSKRKNLTQVDIIEALEKFDGHRENTAKYLGISRRTLHYKLKEMDIK